MPATSAPAAPKQITVTLDFEEQRMLTIVAEYLGIAESLTLNAILRERHDELMRSGDLIGDLA